MLSSPDSSAIERLKRAERRAKKKEKLTKEVTKDNSSSLKITATLDSQSSQSFPALRTTLSDVSSLHLNSPPNVGGGSGLSLTVPVLSPQNIVTTSVPSSSIVSAQDEPSVKKAHEDKKHQSKSMMPYYRKQMESSQYAGYVETSMTTYKLKGVRYETCTLSPKNPHQLVSPGGSHYIKTDFTEDLNSGKSTLHIYVKTDTVSQPTPRSQQALAAKRLKVQDSNKSFLIRLRGPCPTGKIQVFTVLLPGDPKAKLLKHRSQLPCFLRMGNMSKKEKSKMRVATLTQKYGFTGKEAGRDILGKPFRGELCHKIDHGSLGGSLRMFAAVPLEYAESMVKKYYANGKTKFEMLKFNYKGKTHKLFIELPPEIASEADMKIKGMKLLSLAATQIERAKMVLDNYGTNIDDNAVLVSLIGPQHAINLQFGINHKNSEEIQRSRIVETLRLAGWKVVVECETQSMESGYPLSCKYTIRATHPKQKKEIAVTQEYDPATPYVPPKNFAKLVQAQMLSHGLVPSSLFSPMTNSQARFFTTTPRSGAKHKEAVSRRKSSRLQPQGGDSTEKENIEDSAKNSYLLKRLT